MVFENKLQPAACGESHRRQSVDGLRFNLLQSRLLSKNPTDGSRWDSSESPLPCRLDFKYPPTAVGGIGVELLHLFFKDHKPTAKFMAPLTRRGLRSVLHILQELLIERLGLLFCQLAGVDQDAEAEGRLLSRLERVVQRRHAFGEFFRAEGIRREEAVAARVPVCRKSRILLVIEDGDHDVLAFDIAR